MMAQEGFLCSDVGKTATTDLKSCKEAKDVIQKVNPDVDVSTTSIVEENMPGQPKGCIVKENALYFNTASDDTPSETSRQVCKGTQTLYTTFYCTK